MGQELLKIGFAPTLVIDTQEKKKIF